MLLSSGGEGWFLVGGVVAEHGPDDVDPSSGEGDEGLLVGLSFSSFPVVEGTGGWAVLEAGQGGEIAGAQQPSVEATGPVKVDADLVGSADRAAGRCASWPGRR
jgi:hypothetical protein